MEQSKIKSLRNRETEKEREEEIFKMAFAIEDFARSYAQYHLNKSVPQLNIANNKLVMHIQRVVSQNASDFHLEGPEKENFINIPSSNFHHNGSVLVVIVYKDLHELLTSNSSNSDAAKKNRTLDTIIIAATMDPKPEKLQQNVALKFRNLKIADGKRSCMFWSGYSEKNPDGWSGEGCHVVRSKSSSGQTECSCSHMTHFAVLFDYGDNLEITETDEKTLRILTYVGLALSIIGIILTIIFYVYFTDLHQPLSQIRISLASSLGVGQVIFLAGINATENTGVCVAVAALMQYFLIAAFCWMLVEGIYLYLFVVKVYNINSNMKMYYVMSWGFPALMVAISLSIASGKDGMQSFVSEKYCWLSSDNNLIWIFVAFVVIIEAVNVLILVRVIKEMTTMQLTGENHTQQIRLGVKACAVLIPLLGVTWLFGLLSPLHKAFVYIFTILNSAQGFLIFVLHCLRNSQIKERFRRRMNAVFPVSSANDVNSIKKTSQFNESDVGISKEMELHSCNNSVFELK